MRAFCLKEEYRTYWVLWEAGVEMELDVQKIYEEKHL